MTGVIRTTGGCRWHMKIIMNNRRSTALCILSRVCMGTWTKLGSFRLHILSNSVRRDFDCCFTELNLYIPLPCVLRTEFKVSIVVDAIDKAMLRMISTTFSGANPPVEYCFHMIHWPLSIPLLCLRHKSICSSLKLETAATERYPSTRTARGSNVRNLTCRSLLR